MFNYDTTDNVKHFLGHATTDQLLEELSNRYIAFVIIFEILGDTQGTTSLGWAWSKSFSSLMGLIDYGNMRVQKISEEYIVKS